jgi:hypothetical protein
MHACCTCARSAAPALAAPPPLSPPLRSPKRATCLLGRRPSVFFPLSPRLLCTSTAVAAASLSHACSLSIALLAPSELLLVPF